jgi:hypothetical protein
LCYRVNLENLCYGLVTNKGLESFCSAWKNAEMLGNTDTMQMLELLGC